MLYGVKLNEKELLTAKNRLVFLNLYVQKNLKKFWNGNLSLKEGGRGEIY